MQPLNEVTSIPEYTSQIFQDSKFGDCTQHSRLFHYFQSETGTLVTKILHQSFLVAEHVDTIWHHPHQPQRNRQLWAQWLQVKVGTWPKIGFHQSSVDGWQWMLVGCVHERLSSALSDDHHYDSAVLILVDLFLCWDFKSWSSPTRIYSGTMLLDLSRWWLSILAVRICCKACGYNTRIM